MQKISILVLLMIAACFSSLFAVDEESVTKFTPSLTMSSTRGLYSVLSAEPTGEGRLTFSLSSAWYAQAKEFNTSPNKGTDVFTGTISMAFGINPYFDIYALFSGYGLKDYTQSNDNFGMGTFCGGIQGRLPLPATSPVFLGARIGILGGTSSFQINTNAADGYNYFETRTGYDFEGILLQSFRVGKENACVKFHLNEGGVMTLQTRKENLLLLGCGIQVDPHPVISFGVELNSRTEMTAIKFATDPLWVSPVVQFHTPVDLNFTLGSDISLSQKRANNEPRALEPYRIFGSLGFSFDLLASKRKAIKEKEKQTQLDREQELAKREEAEKKNKELQAKADSLAFKAHNDSLQFVHLQDLEKQRTDSIAKKAVADSIQLVETKKKLDEEKSKRTDAEKQLLSTGLLLLDAVYFESGKSEISINSEPYLIIISKMLLKYPKLQVEISGHTDNIGSITANMNLSQARADAVRFFLIQVSPQLSTRLTARGYGPTHPKSNNTSAEGRKVNRRVELQVMNKEVLSEYNR